MIQIDRPNCPICGKRVLWVMRAAGCCLGPFKMRGRDRQVKGAGSSYHGSQVPPPTSCGGSVRLRRNTQPACLSYSAVSRGQERS